MNAVLLGWSLAVGCGIVSVNQDIQEQHVQSVLQEITNMEAIVLVRILFIKSKLLLSFDTVVT